MKVVVDIFGGDNAPDEIIGGCMMALARHKDLSVVMCGDEDVIKQKLMRFNDLSRIEIMHAKEVVTNDDVPTDAIRGKKNSSLVVGLERLKSDPECIGFVSAGSTGAVLTGAFLKVGRIKGVLRPALAPLLPTVQGGKEVLLIDCGANVDCKPQMLVQFAYMGSAYMQTVKNIETPRVGLLSNGTEDKKGNELTKEAFSLLKNEKTLNFAGNMEAREIFSGDYDVVVADGFYGNVALKSCEGAALMVMKSLKREITSGFWSKIGALFMKKAFSSLKNKMDYNKRGGAPFIGVEKPVIKAHGSSKAESICGAIGQVLEMDEAKLIDRVKDYLARVDNVSEK